MRFFNTAGPCHPAKHYMLPALARLDESLLLRLISQEAYFVLHAPRQTGKTTAMLALAEQLTDSGQYIGVFLTMIEGAAYPRDIGKAEDAILQSWYQSALDWLPTEFHPPNREPGVPEGSRVRTFLATWARNAVKPLVVFLDEIDALQDEALFSVLNQLKSGFLSRPQGFPGTIALIGLREVRDYRVDMGGSTQHLNTSSPFNIAAASLTLRDFTRDEVCTLLGQHATETGQDFAAAAQTRIFDLSQGQPWLVNTLAKVCVEELVCNPGEVVERCHVESAKEILVLRQQTHLDQLAAKLQEDRIRGVVEPLLAGSSLDNTPVGDWEYARDLGLVRLAVDGGLEIANPVYGEVIPRVLASKAQAALPALQPDWLHPDGSLAPGKLLEAFLSFWRLHGQPLLKYTPYHEIAPHLVLMAFLHRVVNNHGRIEREYAAGSGSIDLCLFHGATRMALELKVRRAGRPDPTAQGLVQLDAYLDRLGLDTGWLVVFDLRAGLPDIAVRTQAAEVLSPAGRTVTVVQA